MKKMNKLLLLITLVAGVIAFALPAQATTLTFKLGQTFSSEKPDPDGDGPWLTAFFDDQGTTGSVFLTLTANLGTNTVPDPDEPNKVTQWYFNLEDELTASSLNFTLQDSGPYPYTAPQFDSWSTLSSDLQSDGDGVYDFVLFFPTSSDIFDNSDSITYLIELGGISAESFNFPSSTGGGQGTWHTAAKIQSISAGEGSTWICSEGGLVEEGDPVPEPATMLLLGSGLIGLALFSGKKRFKRRNG